MKEIADYLAKHPGAHYPSDIASNLGLDLEVTFQAVRLLVEEGRIETAKKQEVTAR
ncbi:MAG: hypothetical protein ACE5PO_05290 [Candidatus Bathyarchaeia archaeon]